MEEKQDDKTQKDNTEEISEDIIEEIVKEKENKIEEGNSKDNSETDISDEDNNGIDEEIKKENQSDEEKIIENEISEDNSNDKNKTSDDDKTQEDNDKTKEEEMEDNQDETSDEESKIFVIKVTTNKEDRALELISDKVNKKDLSVYSLARPHGLRGYIFLEALNRDSAEEAAYNLPYVKGIIGKTLQYSEIKNMLEPAIEEINIEKGDIVEIISDSFKKEKAKVVRIDKTKGEVVVTLLAAVVSIPVTVKLDNVKVIRREKDEDEEDGEERSEEEKIKEEKIDEDQTPLGEPAQPDIKEDFEGGSGLLIPDDY